ncbi:MAG: prepilin peptidase [Candidatus Pacearchaeota archaeon]
MIWFLFVLALIYVVIAIIQDFKTTEISNWTNFSLVIFALAYRLFYSIFSGNYEVILFGIIGFILFFILAYVFYYARIFAGGDAKLMIALGAVVLFGASVCENTLLLFVFLIALLAGGAFYSLAYTFVIAFVKRKEFAKEFKKQVKVNKKIFLIFISIAVALFVLMIIFNEILFSLFSVVILIFPILLIYTKAVENTCMIKSVDVRFLTVGDWMVNPIKIGKRIIKPHWEGITEEQLKFIQKHYKKKVVVKYGVPFSPAFLIALLVTIAIKVLGYSYWSFWQSCPFF